MSARLDNLRIIDPILTTLSQSYTNNTFIGNRLFPIVKVNKTKGKIPVFGKESFLVRDTRRALRANSNRIPTTDFELIDYETTEYDAEMSMDYLEERESNSALKYEQHITRDLNDIMLLNKEKSIADLVQNPANYTSDMKVIIDSTTAFDDYSNSTDPIQMIRNAMGVVRSKIAKYPNIIVMGVATYNAIINHPTILEKIKYSGVNKVSLDIIRELVEAEEILIGESVYTEDGVTFEDVWADNIILAYVDKSERQRRSEFNPSFGYTFQLKDKPEIDVYFENGGKTKIIRNTDNFDIKITSTDAAFLISNTNHL